MWKVCFNWLIKAGRHQNIPWLRGVPNFWAFSVYFYPFPPFFHKNESKKAWKLGTHSVIWPAFWCWPALKSLLKHTFWIFFLLFSQKRCKKVERKKSLKAAKKSIFASFHVLKAPKSCSKYTFFHSKNWKMQIILWRITRIN